MKFYSYFKISMLILFLILILLVFIKFIKKSYFINNDKSNLILTYNFNEAEDGWNGTENWYNIKYSFNSKDKETSSYRTISFAKPENFNGKYLINFDFVTGENNGNIPTNLNKNKLPSYFIYQGVYPVLKGGIMHNVDNLKDYTIKGPQMIFRYLLKNGYGILNLTQSSNDTLAYQNLICNSGPCNITNNLTSNLSNLKVGQRHNILANINKEKFENINNTFTQACAKKCYNNKSYCSQFSNCNSNSDLYWVTSFGLSSDCKYMINTFTFIKNNIKNLNYDEVSLFGWSVGAAMVSRCINEFTSKSEFNELYKKLNFNWPKNINFALMGAGGSLHCYEMNKYDNKFISTCSYEQNKNFRPHNSNTKNGCCPYFDDTNSNIKKRSNPILEPVYVDIDSKVLWQKHPPVFLFQSANDSYADPFATRSYINTLNYYLNKHNINIRNEISLNESSSIHGMSSDKQINDCIEFIKKIENIN